MDIRIKINKITIQHPLDIYEIMKSVLKREQKVDQGKEHFWVMSLSEANKILNLELVALGAHNRVITRPADVLAVPLRKQAKGIILIHNHPSGNLNPSEKDKDYTNRMIQAGRIMNISVLDHVIITENSYFSFDKSGLLEMLESSLKYVPPYEIEETAYKDGLVEGKEEIAKQMLADKEPMEKIQKWTGLSAAQIKALK